MHAGAARGRAASVPGCTQVGTRTRTQACLCAGRGRAHTCGPSELEGVELRKRRMLPHPRDWRVDTPVTLLTPSAYLHSACAARLGRGGRRRARHGAGVALMQVASIPWAAFAARGACGLGIGTSHLPTCGLPRPRPRPVCVLQVRPPQHAGSPLVRAKPAAASAPGAPARLQRHPSGWEALTGRIGLAVWVGGRAGGSAGAARPTICCVLSSSAFVKSAPSILAPVRSDLQRRQGVPASGT